METEKPKKLENLTEQDIQDWASWALEQAKNIDKEEEARKEEAALRLKKHGNDTMQATETTRLRREN